MNIHVSISALIGPLHVRGNHIGNSRRILSVKAQQVAWFEIAGLPLALQGYWGLAPWLEDEIDLMAALIAPIVNLFYL